MASKNAADDDGNIDILDPDFQTLTEYNHFFDKPLIDFYQEITRLQTDDSISLSTSPLFEMLVKTEQEYIESLEGDRRVQVRHLWKCYDQREFRHSGSDIFHIVQQFQLHALKRLSNISLDFMDTDEFNISYGTDYLIGLFIHVLFVRYRQELEIPPFLLTFREREQRLGENSINEYLGKCLLMSRLNFVLHGNYLPVVHFVYGESHTDVILYIPVMDEDRNCTWRIVFVDSDTTLQILKHEPKLKTRAHHEPHAMMKWFQEKLVNQRDNIVNYDFSYCTEEIQQIVYFKYQGGVGSKMIPDYRIHSGNCAIWAHLMGFHILRHFEVFNSQSTHFDYINVYCKYFDTMLASEPQMRIKFHDFIVHFKTATYHFAKYLLDRVQKQQQHSISEHINPAHFMREILYGPQTSIISLIIKIFKDFDVSMREFLDPIDTKFEIAALNRRIAKLKTARNQKQAHIVNSHTSHTLVFPDLVLYDEPRGRNWERDNSEPNYDEMFPEFASEKSSEEDEDDNDTEESEVRKQKAKERMNRQHERRSKMNSHIKMDKIIKAERLMNMLRQEQREIQEPDKRKEQDLTLKSKRHKS